MKLALLLPGFLDSPDYVHLKTFEKRLIELGYTVERIDPCGIWETGNADNYTITNYLKQVEGRITAHKDVPLEEIVLIGHSLGGLVATIAGSRNNKVTRIVSLCSSLSIANLSKKWQGKSVKYSRRDLPNDPDKDRIFAIPYRFVEDGLQYSALEAIKKINIPVMIFIALEDKSVMPQETEKIVASAHNVFVVRQPGMGHDFRRSQKDCDIVMREIEKFLNSHT